MLLGLGLVACGSSGGASEAGRSPKFDDRCAPQVPHAYHWTMEEIERAADRREIELPRIIDARLHTPGCTQLMQGTFAASIIICCP